MIGPAQLASDTQRAPNGVLRRSSDGLQVFQARLDGFTFSRLRPYQEWATFSTEAFRLWRLYRSVALPTSVLRIALRYINQIDVSIEPGQLLDLSVYLRTYPEISPLLPQTIDGYFSNVQLMLREAGPKLQLIQTVMISSPNILGLILDIDVFWEEALGATNEEIQTVLGERFDLLRDYKNAVFEACITAETRKLFE